MRIHNPMHESEIKMTWTVVTFAPGFRRPDTPFSTTTGTGLSALLFWSSLNPLAFCKDATLLIIANTSGKSLTMGLLTVNNQSNNNIHVINTIVNTRSFFMVN